MTEKQKMANDLSCRCADAYFDCAGGEHRTEEERDKRDAEVVSDFLTECGKWWGIGRPGVCSRLVDYLYPNRPKE